MATPPPTEAPAPPTEAGVESLEDSVKGEPGQVPDPAETRESSPRPADADEAPSPSDAASEGEYSGSDVSEPRDSETTTKSTSDTQPPLPNEPLPDQNHSAPPLPNEPLPGGPSAPPLPAEPVPAAEDDGWDFHWNPNDQSYWFYNRFTGVWQKENPRVPTGGAPTSTATAAAATPAASTTSAAPLPATDPQTGLISNPTSIAGGYNPAIHGDYDENAWYAQALRAPPPAPASTTLVEGQQLAEDHTTAGLFNRHTGAWQTAEQGAERHSDEAKSRRQMRAFFDVDAAANMHDGRSLKAERAGKKPSRAELKAFKERRKAKKEEKRRAWLRD